MALLPHTKAHKGLLHPQHISPTHSPNCSQLLSLSSFTQHKVFFLLFLPQHNLFIYTTMVTIQLTFGLINCSRGVRSIHRPAQEEHRAN